MMIYALKATIDRCIGKGVTLQRYDSSVGTRALTTQAVVFPAREEK